MNKPSTILSIVALFTSLIANPALATTLYYTFETEGTLTSIIDGEQLDAFGYKPGDPIQYVIRVDGDQHAHHIESSEDTGIDWYRWQYNTSFVSGTCLLPRSHSNIRAPLKTHPNQR